MSKSDICPHHLFILNKHMVVLVREMLANDQLCVAVGSLAVPMVLVRAVWAKIEND